MDALERFLTGGLERAGVPLTGEELELMRMVDALYGPQLRALLGAPEVAVADAETDLDPARAPR